MRYAVSSPRRVGRPLSSGAPGAPEAAASGGCRPARRGSRRAGRRGGATRTTLATLTTAGATLAVSGILALVNAGAAQAGGATWASCPGGQATEVGVPAAAGEPNRPAPYLDAGFYVHVASLWPPAPASLCRTGPGRGEEAGEPIFRFGHLSCPGGDATFGVRRPAVPDRASADVPSATWGTYLPAGWYSLDDLSDPSWTSVCWSSRRR